MRSWANREVTKRNGDLWVFRVIHKRGFTLSLTRLANYPPAEAPKSVLITLKLIWRS